MNFHIDLDFLLSLVFQALFWMEIGCCGARRGRGRRKGKQKEWIALKWGIWNGISACGCSIQFIGKYQSETEAVAEASGKGRQKNVPKREKKERGGEEEYATKRGKKGKGKKWAPPLKAMATSKKEQQGDKQIRARMKNNEMLKQTRKFKFIWNAKNFAFNGIS